MQALKECSPDTMGGMGASRHVSLFSVHRPHATPQKPPALAASAAISAPLAAGHVALSAAQRPAATSAGHVQAAALTLLAAHTDRGGAMSVQ